MVLCVSCGKHEIIVIDNICKDVTYAVKSPLPVYLILGNIRDFERDHQYGYIENALVKNNKDFGLIVDWNNDVDSSFFDTSLPAIYRKNVKVAEEVDHNIYKAINYEHRIIPQCNRLFYQK